MKSAHHYIVYSTILQTGIKSTRSYNEVKIQIEDFSSFACENIVPCESIKNTAKEYELKGIKPRDALHLACAIKSESDYLLTCDDKFLKKAELLEVKIKVYNPIKFVLIGVN
jgi:predicted nucleic acid-binding protein